MALPTSVQYGTVSWQAVSAVADSDDDDGLPDAVPVDGTVTFTPSVPVLLSTAYPPVTVFATPVTYDLDDSGILRDDDGRASVTLVATDSPGITPTGWTWTVSYRLNKGVMRGAFAFSLPSGTSVDLTQVAPVSASGGTPIIQGPAGPGLPVAATVSAAGALTVQRHNPVDATSGPLTVTLPTTGGAGALLGAEKTDTSANAVTVSGNLRGVAAQSITLLSAHEVRVFVADSAGSWWPIADHRTKTSLDAAYDVRVALAASPDALIAGAITRDSNGAATSAPVVWPDGTTGTYTATTVSGAFPGAVDAYTITYAGAVTKTYTQPTLTRDSSGAVVTRPAMTVA